MKKLFKSMIMAMTAIAMVGFTRCQNDDNGPDNPTRDVQEATLSIQLSNPAQTKVAGSTPDKDNVIRDLNIFVLNDRDEVTWEAYIDGDTEVSEDDAATAFEIENIAEEPYIMKVTTEAKNVYVIANAGSSKVGTYADMDALHADAINLKTQYTSRWATGSEAVGTFSVGAIPTTTVDVTLKFLAARITITGAIDYGVDPENPENPAIRIYNVTLLNARAQSLLFPNAQGRLIPSTYSTKMTYYEGMENPGWFTNWPEETTYTVYNDNNNFVTAFAAGPDGTFTDIYYYVFENDAITAKTFPTIVTFAGVDNADKNVYYPIHLAPYEAWNNEASGAEFANGIIRGKSYNIDVSISPNTKPDDPTEYVVDALMNVKVEIEDWTNISIGKYW